MAAFFCFLALGSAYPSWAQAAQKAPEPGNKPESIYNVNFVSDSIILGGVTLLDLFPLFNDHNFIHVRSSVNPDDLNDWDRTVIYNRNLTWDDVSDVEAVAAVAVPVIVDVADVGWSHVFLEDMMIFAQTLTINTAIMSLIKYSVQRPLPRVYAGDPSVVGKHRGYEEFYSGHVSTTMSALSAFAMTLDLRHHAGVWPWLVVGGYGLTVALERVSAGEHFPTSVVVGAVMGPAIGILVPWLHHREKPGAAQLGIEPGPGGAQVTWSKRF